jgi:DNA-binding Xre family transcriptional regulator
VSVTVNNRFGILLAERRMKEHRDSPSSEISEETGISRPTLQACANDTVRSFDIPVIDGLCQYFGMLLGELFEYIEGNSILLKKREKRNKPLGSQCE